MMGSRGDPPAQATALATLLEIADLLRNADKILPAGVIQLREAEKAARDARSDVDKANEALAAHRAEFIDLQHALIDRQTAFGLEVAAHQAKVAEIEQQQASFAEQRATLEVRKQELDRHAAAIEGDIAEFEAAKLLHASDHQAKVAALFEETDRQRRECAAALQATHDQALADIRGMRARAQQEITAAQEMLQAREDRIAEREEQLHKERARLSALLRD